MNFEEWKEQMIAQRNGNTSEIYNADAVVSKKDDVTKYADTKFECNFFIDDYLYFEMYQSTYNVTISNVQVVQSDNDEVMCTLDETHQDVTVTLDSTKEYKYVTNAVFPDQTFKTEDVIYSGEQLSSGSASYPIFPRVLKFFTNVECSLSSILGFDSTNKTTILSVPYVSSGVYPFDACAINYDNISHMNDVFNEQTNCNICLQFVKNQHNNWGLVLLNKNNDSQTSPDYKNLNGTQENAFNEITELSSIGSYYLCKFPYVAVEDYCKENTTHTTKSIYMYESSTETVGINFNFGDMWGAI